MAMSPERKAFAEIAQLIEDARLLDCSGASPSAVLRANQMRLAAEEIARLWALGEEARDAA